MQITSNQVTIARSAEDVYTFIADFRNFGQLMPPQVLNYEATYDNCSFEISGMGSVALEMKERIPATKVKSVSTGSTAIAFELNVDLVSESADSCKAVVQLDAQLSMMLQMIASAPLKNFINMLAGKLREVMEAS